MDNQQNGVAYLTFKGMQLIKRDSALISEREVKRIERHFRRISGFEPWECRTPGDKKTYRPLWQFISSIIGVPVINTLDRNAWIDQVRHFINAVAKINTGIRLFFKDFGKFL